MKHIFRTLLMLGLAAGLLRPALAQTTNGVTTGAERQALSDAYTRSEAVRRASATPSSPGANTPLYSGSGRAQTLTEKTAEMNALFGFEKAEQKAAARRAVAERDRANQAARDRQAVEDARSRAWEAAQRQQLRDFNSRAETAAVPWFEARFTAGDARQLGYITDPRNVADMKPETLALLARLKASRAAFLALYRQPNAGYEQLRQLAQQLPQKSTFRDLSGGWTFGLGTAMQQYDLLYRRFPDQASAAADALRASRAYLGWDRLTQEGFEEPLLGQQALRVVADAVAAYPALDAGGAAGLSACARMGYTHGADSALITRLAREAYASLGRRLRTGSEADGPEAGELRAEASTMAELIANFLYSQQRLPAARQWLLRACQANSAGGRVAASNFICWYPDYATLLREMTPADWSRVAPALGMAVPTRPAAVMAWLQDTVFVPDHPRWAALTADQQADLAQARVLAEQLLPTANSLYAGGKRFGKSSAMDMRLITWAFVADAAGSPTIKQAISAWVAAAEEGSELGARNAYRAYLLGDKTAPLTPERGQLAPLYRLAQYGGEQDKGAHKYRAALVLLDELPGYPPLGRANRHEGRRWVQEAAAAGCAAAADRLKRGF